ncbi:MAG: aminopeptidase P family N-terminal domain-containing protein, partial [Methylococcaceae bacterium]
MKELIKQRISALRKEMQQNQLDAFIIYGTDPHLSEYIPSYWQTRPFISGFTGSAGQVIVTAQKAALWTDSRYFIQAEDELKGTDIELVKIRVAGYPSPGEWLKINLSEGAVVGTDEACISIEQFRSLEKNLQESAIALIGTADLLNAVWVDRPPLPNNKIYDHEIHYAC